MKFKEFFEWVEENKLMDYDVLIWDGWFMEVDNLNLTDLTINHTEKTVTLN